VAKKDIIETLEKTLSKKHTPEQKKPSTFFGIMTAF